MNNGWIKLHRSIIEWEWWDDRNTRDLFVYCLLKANATDKVWHGRVVERGSFVTSLPDLAKHTGLTIQQTRTSLDKLKVTGEITDRATAKNRVITICNYDNYQDKKEGKQQTEQQAEQHENNREITDNQQTEQHENNREITDKITDRATAKNRVITICNYDNYQDKKEGKQQTEQQAEQHENNREITDNQQTNNSNEEYKNIIIQENNNISHSTARTREEEESEGMNEVEKKVAVNDGGEGHGTTWTDVERLYDEYRGELTTEDSEAGSAAVRLMMGCGMLGNIGWVTAKLDEFQDLKRMSGSKGDTRSNYRRHFTSWLRIELEKETRKNSNTNNGNTSNRPQEAERVPQYTERY